MMKTKRCLKLQQNGFILISVHNSYDCTDLSYVYFAGLEPVTARPPTGAWASPLFIPFFCLFCRTRTCNSPAPKGLGLPCPGPTTDLTTCESNSSASGKIFSSKSKFSRKERLNFHFFCSLKRQCQETVFHLIIVWGALISTQVFEFEYLPAFTRILQRKNLV